MKNMKIKVTGMRKALTVTVMVAVGSLNSMMMSSVAAQTAPKASGEINVRGAVTLNGINAANGSTIFDAGRVKTGSNGAATLNLGKLGQIELAADSELVLKISAGEIGGNLLAGHAVVNAPAGVSVNVVTPDGVATTAGNESAILAVDVNCGNTHVLSSRSEAKVNTGAKVEVVAAGKEVTVGAQNAPTCKRVPVVAAATGLGSGALAALLIAGIGGAITAIVAITQSDDTNSGSLNISGFRP
jgi:ferric-dicitrate binding protein FerR (iron transport regulator)